MTDAPIVATATERLRSYGVGSLLSSASLAIAAFTMVFLVNLVRATIEAATNGLRGAGAELLFVNAVPETSDGARVPRPLTLADGTALEREVREIAELGGSVTVRAMAVRCGRQLAVRVVGVAESQWALDGWRVASGRFIASNDVAERTSVAVLGNDVRGVDCHGSNSHVLVAGQAFRVVGELEAKGIIFGQAVDDVVLVPLSTMRGRFPQAGNSVALTVRLREGSDQAEVKRRMERVLRVRHGLRGRERDDFVVQSQGDLLVAARALERAAVGVVVSLVSVCTLIAAINVLSSLVARVAARRSEVGLRRSLGATRMDIRMQFLAEAVTVSAAGAISGSALGVIAFSVCSRMLDLEALTDWWTVLATCAMVAAFGVAGGLAPAVAAANQSPIDALRHE